MAERYPGSQILAVSNSTRQRAHIQQQCRQRALGNVQVVTQDVNSLQVSTGSFDRCISIEMFEHMRNYALLLDRIRSWLRPGGKLFVHLFAHRELLYAFDTGGAGNWLGRHFFTGGLMPAADTLLWFQRHLRIEQRWLLDGTHYQRTADHWLANHDANRGAVMRALREAYGAAGASLWYQRGRMFWMACAELFGYESGQEWLVAHYRLSGPA
ncbi:MAG TPA: class I SAM-dependent methyltransferase [Steroidobacteraceae bacterium]